MWNRQKNSKGGAEESVLIFRIVEHRMNVEEIDFFGVGVTYLKFRLV